MRIAIEALGMELPGGGRFTALNLMQGILEEDHENQYLIFVSQAEDSLRQFSNARQHVIASGGRFAVRVKAQLTIPSLLRAEKVDLAHFIKNLGVLCVPCKTLVSIYDLTILKYPRFFPWTDVAYWRTVQALTLRLATHVAVLSNSTKRDAIKYYRLAPDKISTIYSACDPMFRPLPPGVVEETRLKYGLPQRYILSVGNISPKKNFETLVKAIAWLKQQGSPAKLVIVGQEYWVGGQRPLSNLIQALGLEQDVVLLGAVVGQDLVALYNGATLFAFPSLDEGFGIVLAEAMSSGTPVIASGTSAIPEVVGDAGILLQNPQDETELAEAMSRVIADDALRQSMIVRGLARARRFSWRQAGQEYVKLYRDLVTSA